ncbi:hypothetical protein JAAARDRAFT_188014 [Jaapia argillacea MUCL 33604]|uniref:Uncharacterized protein n=1 Tax=Jaapia argillacea MUCL 33604 TaxID=933084 RepID=A0A067QPZ8_9AGAM|nr:hypothetical protein JAAARDRAFT_188014 [Jaapia argillacea MUCL 33604]
MHAAPAIQIVKRQGLVGGLESVFSDKPATSISINSDPLGLGGIITSVIPPILSFPSSSTTSSSSSASTTSVALSSTAASFTSSSSRSPSITPHPPPPSPTPSPSSSSTVVYTSTVHGGSVTITSVVDPESPPTSSPSAAPSRTGFFQNKPLEGGVFALVAVIVVVFLVSIATIAIRRAKNNRLVEDAVKWPETGFNSSPHDLEKGQIGSLGSMKGRRPSNGSSRGYGVGSDGSSHGHGTIITSDRPPGLFGPNGYGQGGFGPLPVPPKPAGYPQGQVYAAGPHMTPYAGPYMGMGRNVPPNASYQTYPRPGAAIQGNQGFVVGPEASSTMVQFPRDERAAIPRLETNFPPAYPSAGKVPEQLSPGSLLNPSPPVSPIDNVDTGSAKVTRRVSSDSRELDPALPSLPPAPALPDSFGWQDVDHGAEARDEMVRGETRVLKVANE